MVHVFVGLCNSKDFTRKWTLVHIVYFWWGLYVTDKRSCLSAITWIFRLNELNWEVVVHFVDIGGIVDHHCLNFLFIKHLIQGFQYLSSVPVLHYLQVVLRNKIWTFSWISYTEYSFKSGGTKYHFKRVKIPGTAPYWKAC